MAHYPAVKLPVLLCLCVGRVTVQADNARAGGTDANSAVVVPTAASQREELSLRHPGSWRLVFRLPSPADQRIHVGAEASTTQRSLELHDVLRTGSDAVMG